MVKKSVPDDQYWKQASDIINLKPPRRFIPEAGGWRSGVIRGRLKDVPIETILILLRSFKLQLALTELRSRFKREVVTDLRKVFELTAYVLNTALEGAIATQECLDGLIGLAQEIINVGLPPGVNAILEDFRNERLYDETKLWQMVSDKLKEVR